MKFQVQERRIRLVPIIGWGLLAVIVGGFVWLLSSFPDCSAGSKQARMARSLSASRLQELHQAMIALRSSLPEDERDFRQELWRDDLPPVFHDLNCALVRYGGDSPLIRLEGCMDHHLDLMFYGIGESSQFGDHSPRITLVSGEFDVKEEVLWRPEDQGSGSRAKCNRGD